ncbi:MAG: helix-turn-helix domain-containing protein [Clostridia bacterium]
MCFCTNLKNYRQEKNVSQKKMAELMGVAPSTYSLCLLVIFNTINRLSLRGDTFNRFYFLA